MRKLMLILIVIFYNYAASSQSANTAANANDNEIKRPKLVVGIVIDQMRWDYLYRYYNLYQPDGGFKRLLSQGFSCENTMIPYIPSFTACGHTSIYTGSVPAIDGITGNDWWDYDVSKLVYCTEDVNEQTVGSSNTEGKMSPHNMLVTTIGDELRLATNFNSKVIGIALKDRAAILPAGHSANAAYWYDDTTGNWITSTYYMKDLPGWVKDINSRKLVDSFYAKDWNTLYPLSEYTQSAPDVEPYEYRPFGGKESFPYSLQPYIGKAYGIIHVIPAGNTFTFDMAKAAITGEQLGKSSNTDMLAISISTTDYIGHTFGPNSVEAEDNFLRLDKDIGDFLNFLDQQIGKGQYLVFLTADHGVAHVPAFLKQHSIPAGNVDDEKISDQLNALLKDKFSTDNLVIGIVNNQVFLDHNALSSSKKIDKQKVYDAVIDFLIHQSGIARAFAIDALNEVTLNSTIKNKVANGYYPSRSGDIQIIFQPQWIDGFLIAGTTHGEWNPYDAHIPLVWYGWNITPGKTNREVDMTDIAPTIAAMLHIQMPSGSIGKVITEVSGK
ncbi:MAG: alkaline phosphatase family protein [Bacteroidetes bacterium]|nr:alkaline phosphatase family protein [Bacteroidota bacterium]